MFFAPAILIMLFSVAAGVTAIVQSRARRIVQAQRWAVGSLAAFFVGCIALVYATHGPEPKATVAVSGQTPPPDELKAAVLQHFYAAVTRKDYAAAYAKLSPALRVEEPPSDFASRYKDVADIRLLNYGAEPNSNHLAVQILSSPKSGGPNTIYEGTVGFIYNRASDSWLINYRDLKATTAEAETESSTVAVASETPTSGQESETGSVCYEDNIVSVSGTSVTLPSDRYTVDDSDASIVANWHQDDAVRVCAEGSSFSLTVGDAAAHSQTAPVAP